MWDCLISVGAACNFLAGFRADLVSSMSDFVTVAHVGASRFQQREREENTPQSQASTTNEGSNEPTWSFGQRRALFASRGTFDDKEIYVHDFEKPECNVLNNVLFYFLIRAQSAPHAGPAFDLGAYVQRH